MERQLLGEAMRRTKATLIYRRTKNLRAVQLWWATPSWRRLCATSGRAGWRLGDLGANRNL